MFKKNKQYHPPGDKKGKWDTETGLLMDYDVDTSHVPVELPDLNPEQKIDTDDKGAEEVWRQFYNWYQMHDHSHFVIEYENGKFFISYSIRLKSFVGLLTSAIDEKNFRVKNHQDFRKLFHTLSETMGKPKKFRYARPDRTDVEIKLVGAQIIEQSQYIKINGGRFQVQFEDHPITVTFYWNTWSLCYQVTTQIGETYKGATFYSDDSLSRYFQNLVKKFGGGLVLSRVQNP